MQTFFMAKLPHPNERTIRSPVICGKKARRRKPGQLSARPTIDEMVVRVKRYYSISKRNVLPGVRCA